jgi:hypothetical protein
VKAELNFGDGVELMMGAPLQDLGHLAGRDERNATWSPWMPEWHATRKKAEWLVRAPGASSITVTASAQRAGVTRKVVQLQ